MTKFACRTFGAFVACVALVIALNASLKVRGAVARSSAPARTEDGVVRSKLQVISQPKMMLVCSAPAAGTVAIEALGEVGHLYEAKTLAWYVKVGKSSEDAETGQTRWTVVWEEDFLTRSQFVPAGAKQQMILSQELRLPPGPYTLEVGIKNLGEISQDGQCLGRKIVSRTATVTVTETGQARMVTPEILVAGQFR